MATPRAICFDLDDTLLDNEDSYLQSLALICRELVEEHGLADPERLAQAYKDAADAYFATAAALVLSDWVRVRGALWRDALIACGYNDPHLHAWAAERYEELRRRTITVFADTLPFLKSLAGLTGKLGVITNGAQEIQEEKLRIAGIDSFFAVVVTSAAVGVAKPAPAVFHHALDAIGVRPENAWHVGDSLTMDVAGAKAAGLTAVWLNRRGTERTATDPVPDHEIASLSELLPLLSL